MFLNRRMDKDKMRNIYTMEYYSVIKKRHLEICMQMDGSGKNHPERGNPDPEREIWYVLTHE